MSQIVIACGGTGGHLAPGIAVAEVLEARGHRCLLLISQKQVDSKLVEKYGHLRFERTPGRAFSGGLTKRLGSLLSLVEGFFFSRKLLRREQPDLVLLFGGFLSVGLAYAAKFKGLPIALHEANGQPGRTVRMVKGFATRLYLPDGVSLPGVADTSIRYLGYPVRGDIQRVLPEPARERLGLSVAGKLLVIIGGSQGAKALNDWVIQNFEALAEQGISVYCVTGLGGAGVDRLEHINQAGETIRASFVPFSDAMGDVISAADLVVSRAGAGSIAEIVRCRAPSILIPYPHAMDDHQRVNARMHVANAAGVWMDQEAIESKLLDEVVRLMADEDACAEFRAQMERMDAFDSSQQIAEDLGRLSRGELPLGDGSIEAMGSRD
ncbi:MAG: UDP-N-acetylglucosamine--N-acetylmuramyl-(pentapeptide) pyrophosphoryl-undecaprenol N-acetylglucosamine transferase [Verrucomicrobiota bacterium]